MDAAVIRPINDSLRFGHIAAPAKAGAHNHRTLLLKEGV
jgi:hypothetical protein